MTILDVTAVTAGEETNRNQIKYERKRWPYIFSLPLMWVLSLWVRIKKKILGRNPRINTFWFDGLSVFCREIKEGAASWRALDLIYNHYFGANGKVSDFWIGMINAQAVRNRLRLARYLLGTELRRLAQGGEVRLLSIACGSAQAVIETMADLKTEGIFVKAILLDLDPSAIDYSKQLAEKMGVRDQISFLAKGVNALARTVGEFDPHVVEMIGFLEYRSDEKAVRLVRQIYRLLVPGGIFLTCSICDNPERPFLHWVVDWPMIYRSPEELLRVVTNGGFEPHACRVVLEPHKIHAVAVCRKLE